MDRLETVDAAECESAREPALDRSSALAVAALSGAEEHGSEAALVEPIPFIERLEWEEPACVAPGLARLRIVTPEVTARSSVRASLAVHVVGENDFDHTDPRFAPQNVARLPLLPAGQTVHARVSETARIGQRVWAVVTATADNPTEVAGRTETYRSPPLHVLGDASFWVGPRWEHETCSEGDSVRIGAATRGLPPGATVRVTITGATYGPAVDDEERSRSAAVDHLDTALDDDGAFSVTWTARHDQALIDQAAYLGWPAPRYYATVEVLGLVGATGDLAMEG